MTEQELQARAFAIADEAAQSAVECATLAGAGADEGWLDFGVGSEGGDQDWIDCAEDIEYLEARGLLERHPRVPGLVRFVPPAWPGGCAMKRRVPISQRFRLLFARRGWAFLLVCWCGWVGIHLERRWEPVDQPWCIRTCLVLQWLACALEEGRCPPRWVLFERRRWTRRNVEPRMGSL